MKILEVQNICKEYPKFYLDNVSFDIEEGTIVGFIGRNGAGKTTTLKGIYSLIKLDSGTIQVFGKPYKMHEYECKQDMAFSLSEINYFMDYRIGRLTKVTKKFYDNWDDEIYYKLCDKFNLDQRKKIKELSSGMKVKYNLAIALSHHAKLLILDEPTSGLDPVSRDEILDIFKSLVKDGKRSILFSTHITSDLDKCATHIVYIKDGKIIDSKTKDEFINRYRYVEGKIEKLKDMEKYLISYKETDTKFTGLILQKNEEKVPDSVKLFIPDLETIMVYEERKGDQDEEFTF